MISWTPLSYSCGCVSPGRWCWRMSQCTRLAWPCTENTSSGPTGSGGPCSVPINTRGETWRCCVPTSPSSRWGSSLWPTTQTAVSFRTESGLGCLCEALKVVVLSRLKLWAVNLTFTIMEGIIWHDVICSVMTRIIFSLACFPSSFLICCTFILYNSYKPCKPRVCCNSFSSWWQWVPWNDAFSWSRAVIELVLPWMLAHLDAHGSTEICLKNTFRNRRSRAKVVYDK